VIKRYTVFRPALVANAAAIIVMHDHPSGDANPSDADIKVTRDLIRAGQLLKVELLDHVIVGTVTADRPGHQSLRLLGISTSRNHLSRAHQEKQDFICIWLSSVRSPSASTLIVPYVADFLANRFPNPPAKAR
jgi:hypothetical protein